MILEDLLAATRHLQDEAAHALKNFARRDFDDAADCVRNCLERLKGITEMATDALAVVERMQGRDVRHDVGHCNATETIR